MKNSVVRVVILIFGMVLMANMAFGQKEIVNEISYDVNFGPVFPIEGTSNQITSKASFNEVTGEFEKISFDVNVNSFIGQNSGYLGWIANSWQNPDMSFTGSSITMKGNELLVEGTLEFRRKTGFVQITMVKKLIGNSVFLSGHFQINTNDYFLITPHPDLVPTWIPFKVTLVFDKSSVKEKTTNN